jgi:ABC-type dipeptide/oligopeptide/nickel transport system permease component
VIVFISRRLAQALPVVFLASVGVFLLLHLLPGDPAILMAGPDAPPATIEFVRHDMGLDQPLPVQYAVWLGHIVRGDLGKSIFSKLPVSQLIGQRAPATIELAVFGELLTIVIALPLGISAAVKQRTALDWILSSATSIGLAVPNFWLGILLILLFAVALGWLPPGQRGDFLRDPVGELKFLTLPAFTLALPLAMNLSRLTKASVLEMLYEDHVRTARAKGLDDVAVVNRHVLRNALVPIVTAIGLDFGRLLGGALVVETIFAWPGLGTLMLSAVGNRDYVVVQACLLLLVGVFILVNLVTDISYGFLDPRIRLAAGGRRA